MTGFTAFLGQPGGYPPNRLRLSALGASLSVLLFLIVRHHVRALPQVMPCTYSVLPDL